MNRLYYIDFKGLYTDDYEKKGEWKRIVIQKGKSTQSIYSKDNLDLNQNFITIKTIADEILTIAVKFIITIETVYIKYDKNREEINKASYCDTQYIEHW